MGCVPILPSLVEQPLLIMVFLSVEWAQERLESISETVCVRATGLAWHGLLVPGRRQHFLGPQA